MDSYAKLKSYSDAMKSRYKVHKNVTNYGAQSKAAPMAMVEVSRQMRKQREFAINYGVVVMGATQKPDIWDYYHNQRGGSCNGS